MSISPMAKVIALHPRSAEPARHVNLHPSMGRRLDVAEPTPDLFDWASDPDRPIVPLLVSCALDRVLAHINTPGMYTRAQVVEAAQVVRSHFRRDLDWTPPQGIARPEMDGAS